MSDTHPDFQHYRQLLEQRLAALDQRLHHIEDDLDQPHSRDWDDQAIEREGDEMLESMGSQGLVEVAQIKAALARMDAGTFGLCQGCDEPISEARLAVLPHTPWCKDCAGPGHH